MAQKVNPIGIRIGVSDNSTWSSRWYADRGYAALLKEDFEIRDFVKKRLSQAAVSKIEIERIVKKVIVTIHTAKPGVVIGKKGGDIEDIKKSLAKISSSEVSINIVEVRKPDIDSVLVAENVAMQLQKRVSFRRAMKRAIQSALKMGAKGIRINCSGRLGGAEIARMEWYREGRVPLHTLRAIIDYGTAEAHTTYGVIGVKVWIYKGEAAGVSEKGETKTL
jgi:small subunit ribosomal protein S3